MQVDLNGSKPDSNSFCIALKPIKAHKSVDLAQENRRILERYFGFFRRSEKQQFANLGIDDAK